MAGTKITYYQVINVLLDATGPVSLQYIVQTLRPNPMSPADAQKDKNTILFYLNTGRVAGDIGIMDNCLYFLIDPAAIQFFSESPDSSDSEYSSDYDYKAESPSESDTSDSDESEEDDYEGK